uniref:Uncharacterized protein n=1 Tax=Lepeophtheirus salmonis TaxID=72036 RepID=A0A0K2USG0_LEPSM
MRTTKLKSCQNLCPRYYADLCSPFLVTLASYYAR